MKYILGTFVTVLLFTTSTFASSAKIVGSDADEHGCIGSAGYVWNESSKMCERPWEKKIYSNSKDFLASEGTTCKLATDGCNTIQITNGQLGASTMMYCENINGTKLNEQWSCLDDKLEQDTIGFLPHEKQIEYKEFKKAVGEKIASKVSSTVNNFGDKVLNNVNFDITKGYKIIDKAIEKIELHLTTSKYANQKTYKMIQLLVYELKILKNHWEQNTGVISN